MGSLRPAFRGYTRPTGRHLGTHDAALPMHSADDEIATLSKRQLKVVSRGLLSTPGRHIIAAWSLLSSLAQNRVGVAAVSFH